jgi:hypothetical protein
VMEEGVERLALAGAERRVAHASERGLERRCGACCGRPGHP